MKTKNPPDAEAWTGGVRQFTTRSLGTFKHSSHKNDERLGHLIVRPFGHLDTRPNR